MADKIKEYDALLPALGGARSAWDELVGFVNENYEMDELWTAGKPGGNFYKELKFRRGGKTLITLYLREGFFLAMIILGKAERGKFEERMAEFSPKLCEIYENTKTYHDGKWLILEMQDNSLVADAAKLLLIKRKPNRKS